LHVAALILFGAAAVSDLLGIVSATAAKFAQARITEVTLDGMAQGSVPQGIRDQIWRRAREKGEQTSRGDDRKAD